MQNIIEEKLNATFQMENIDKVVLTFGLLLF